LITQNDKINNGVTLALQFIYGMIMALSLLGLISTVVLCCCTVVRVRLAMYFTCTFLILFAFITFAMLIIVGALVPLTSQSCKYIDDKLTTPEGRVELFNKLQFN